VVQIVLKVQNFPAVHLVHLDLLLHCFLGNLSVQLVQYLQYYQETREHLVVQMDRWDLLDRWHQDYQVDLQILQLQFFLDYQVVQFLRGVLKVQMTQVVLHFPGIQDFLADLEVQLGLVRLFLGLLSVLGDRVVRHLGDQMARWLLWLR
jgi:hypothetical protein